jgi:hypothetical protein
MKKIILSLGMFMVLSFSLFAHNDPYTTAMNAAVDKLNQCKAAEEYLESANRFERIAFMEKDKWLPYYYASYAYIQMSFMEQDMPKRDMILDKAQVLLDSAMGIRPDESELHVLQALLYPSRIIVDPMGRGMQYIGLMFESLGKAKSLNPENPRIYFLEAINTLNLPPAMGGGAELAKPIFEKAQEKYNSFQPESEIAPDWGKEAVEAELVKLN